LESTVPAFVTYTAVRLTDAESRKDTVDQVEGVAKSIVH
jgi:hypothetical protein